MCETTPETIFALVPYEDGSTPRLKVSEGIVFEQSEGGERTIKIEGVGGSVLVHANDVTVLISALKVSQRHFDLHYT